MGRGLDLTLPDDGRDDFDFLDPPFSMNSPHVAQLGLEVTGYRLLRRLWTQLGWTSLGGRRLLDLGCGVRFARTLHNLDLPIARYVGVDQNAEAIAWLQERLGGSPRYEFVHVDAPNAFYNPEGRADPHEVLAGLRRHGFDAACMHSVVTHQDRDEAAATFAALRAAVETGARLHFTAFLDPTVDGMRQASSEPGRMVEYHPDTLVAIVEAAGWRVDAIHTPPPQPFWQTPVVATAVGQTPIVRFAT